MPAAAWDFPYHALVIFFQIFRAPRLRLRTPELIVPDAYVVLTVVLVTYYFITSGIILDVLHTPPSMGMQRDPVTGIAKPAAVMSGRVNSQYLFEGFTLGAFYALGATGFILLKQSAREELPNKWSYTYSIVGIIALIVSQKICEQCLAIKMPSYLKGYYA